ACYGSGACYRPRAPLRTQAAACCTPLVRGVHAIPSSAFARRASSMISSAHRRSGEGGIAGGGASRCSLPVAISAAFNGTALGNFQTALLGRITPARGELLRQQHPVSPIPR